MSTTGSMTAGTWQLKIVFSDASERTANISLIDRQVRSSSARRPPDARFVVRGCMGRARAPAVSRVGVSARTS